MRLLYFNKFKLFELKTDVENLLTQKSIYNLKIVDKQGISIVRVKLEEFGWSLHRNPIYYEFTILESDSDKLLTGGVIHLNIDFNKKQNTFHYYPYLNDQGNHKREQMTEKTITAYIELL